MVTVFIGSAYTHQVIGGYKGKGMLLSGQVVYLASNPRPGKANYFYLLESSQGDEAGSRPRSIPLGKQVTLS